jgi:ATP-dependent DNA helicase RecQ
MHPSRRKLAGRAQGQVYDRLLRTQAELARGAAGTDKPMSCPAPLLARVASLRQADIDTLTRLMGERLAERFGPAFLEVLHEA